MEEFLTEFENDIYYAANDAFYKTLIFKLL